MKYSRGVRESGRKTQIILETQYRHSEHCRYYQPPPSVAQIGEEVRRRLARLPFYSPFVLELIHGRSFAVYRQVWAGVGRSRPRATLGITHVNAAIFRLREISMNPPPLTVCTGQNLTLVDCLWRCLRSLSKYETTRGAEQSACGIWPVDDS